MQRCCDALGRSGVQGVKRSAALVIGSTGRKPCRLGPTHLNEVLPGAGSAFPDWVIWFAEWLGSIISEILRSVMVAFDAPETISILRNKVNWLESSH